MESTTQAELNQYLAALNENWQTYDQIERGELTFQNNLARREALRIAADRYEFAQAWLAEHGQPWISLLYNPITKSYSFPPSETSA